MFKEPGARMSIAESPMPSASEREWMSFAPRLRLAPKDLSGYAADQLLPTGTVTLLMADIEGSTRIWETRPDEMAAALANMDRTLDVLVHANNGVRPISQGEGDSFVVALIRPSDAVACALALQQAALSPIRLRIGVHTGEILLQR
jgi:class 3 adenylate cyclase